MKENVLYGIKLVSFLGCVWFIIAAYLDPKCDIKTFNLLLFMFGIFFLKVLFVKHKIEG